MNKPIIIAIGFIIISVSFYWFATGHLIRPFALIIGAFYIALLFTNITNFMSVWIIASPIVNWYLYRYADPAGLNAITLREILDFDRMSILAAFMYLKISGFAKIRTNSKTRLTVLNFPIILFIASMTWSCLFKSYNDMNALKITFDAIIIPFMLIIISRDIFTTPETFNKLIRVFVLLSLYLVILGAFELIYTGNVFRRIRWPFVFWETYGFTLSILFTVIMFVYFTRIRVGIKESIFNRYGYLMILMILGVFFTLTRAAWLTLFSGTIFFLHNSSKIIKNPLKKWVFGGSAVIAIILTTVMVVLPSSITESDIYKRRVSNQSTLDNRFQTFEFAFDQIKKYPITGIGFRNFRDYYGLHYDFTKDTRASNPGRSTLHSLYINILTEQGILGLSLFIIVIIKIMSKTRVFIFDLNTNVKLWGYLGISTIIIYLISGILYDPLFDPPYFVTKLSFIIFGTFYTKDRNFIKSFSLYYNSKNK
ncbi:O-antigen ligase family protein [Thermodesulfobacteriota bacterium]